MYSGAKKALSVLFLLLSSWFFITFLLPFSLPFLLGGALALASEPLVGWLCRHLKLGRCAAAGLGVTAAFCLISAFLAAVLALVLRELGILVSMLSGLEDTASAGIRVLSAWATGLVSRLPLGIRNVLTPGIRDFFSGSSRLLEQVLNYLLGLTGGVLRQVPDGALVLGTAIISSYMISAKLPRIRHWLRQRISQERVQKLLQALGRVKATLLSWLKAQLKLMGLTWILLTLGLVVLRVTHAPLWAGLISLVDAFPILGTGTVMLPWALVSFLQGQKVRAVGLLGVYAVIALTRSVMEPKLLGNHLGLDSLATLVCLYAGYRLWGFGGMLLAPVLTVAAVQILRPTA